MPKIAAALALAFLPFPALPPRRAAADLEGFGALPALHSGRLKPLDTIARSGLLLLRGKQSVRFEGRSVSAIEWMLDVMARPRRADAYPVFAIDEPDLRGMLGRRRGGGKYFSYRELEASLDKIEDQYAQAARLEPAQRSRFQSAAFNLGERLGLYQSLQYTLQISATSDLPAELRDYRAAIPAGLKAIHAGQAKARSHPKALEALNEYFQRYQFLSERAHFRPIPPAQGDAAEQWQNMGQALLEAMRSKAHPATESYAQMAASWARQDFAGFNEVLAEYRKSLSSAHQGPASWARHESHYNRIAPFYLGMILYLAALMMVFGSWLGWRKPLQRSAFVFLLLAFAVHSAGLFFRVVLQGRPPVTNLYSSAVFVGWVAAALAAELERRYRDGLATAAGCAMGFATLLVAHHLMSQGDTVEMMRAVLDSNFWLATHVVTITLGYGASFLACALAHLYLGRGFVGASDPKAQTSLSGMTYGVICFSLFFSFIGTVLGGIWADQSWGRFWGWDPKENGALLIVLWNALILHARWGGFIRERGLMLTSVFGGVVTAFSWFGVNMLGVGLHSYGFTDKAFGALILFVGVELAVMGLGARPASVKLK